MLWQSVVRDDVAVPVLDAEQSRELGEAAAWVICMEAGERAREGTLLPEDRASYERELRCVLAAQPAIVKTYTGYLDLAILAGQILLKYAKRGDVRGDAPPCGP